MFQAEWLEQGMKKPRKKKGTMLEVESHQYQALYENQVGRGTEQNGKIRLTI